MRRWPSPIARFLLVSLVCLSASPAAAQDVARMEQVVQSYTAARQFMGSVLVATGDKVVFSKGFGSANLEWDLPDTPTTKFRIGSVTKQFTAASILLLEERGRLSVTDPVKKHLPNAPAAWDAITIAHLLSHTAGVPNYTSFPEFQTNMARTLSTEQLVATFRDKPLEFVPGRDWKYSNSGYVLLGLLIEKTTGDSYAQFVRTNIFTPLGMTDSGYDSHFDVIARRAAGYAPGPAGLVNAPYVDMSLPHAAGALYSTTEDLLKWQQALFGGKLLSAASLAKMTTPVRSNYGYGITIAETGGRKVISHNGGINGFNSVLAHYPGTQTTVIVLSNVNGQAAEAIATRLAALSHGEAVSLPSEVKETTVSSAALADYVGTYSLETGGATMLIRLEKEQLTAQIAGQPRLPLFAESGSRFFLKVVDAQIDFSRDDKGVVSHLVLHQGGRDMKAVRTAATVPADRVGVAVPPEALPRLAGTYELRPGFDLTITVENNTVMGQATGQPKFPLAAESPTKFFIDAASIAIEFVSDDKGVVTHIVFQQGPATINARRK